MISRTKIIIILSLFIVFIGIGTIMSCLKGEEKGEKIINDESYKEEKIGLLGSLTVEYQKKYLQVL